VLVENQQYIHYRKGSLVMYALRDYIGEERVNRALAKFLHDHAFESAPYTTATELVKYFRAEAPPEYQETSSPTSSSASSSSTTRPTASPPPNAPTASTS
jgi:aminopeptidase N